MTRSPSKPGTASADGLRVGEFNYAARLASNALAMGVSGALVLLLSLLAGGWARWLLRGDSMFSSWMLLLVAAWIVGAWMSRLLPGWGLGAAEELRRTVSVLMMVFAGTTAMLFWGKASGGASRLTLTLGAVLSLVMVPLARTGTKRWLLRRGLWGCPTVVYGDSETTPEVIRALRDEAGLGYMPVGLFMDGRDAADAASQETRVPTFGGIQDSTSAASIAVVALPHLASEAMSDLMEGPLDGYRKVVIVPDLENAPSLWVKPRDLGGMLGLEISINLLDPVARISKRTADLTLTLATAPLWMPLCFLIALLIRLEDRGAPLFLQERIGLHGRVFRTWKFRTMHPEAEQVLQRHLANDAALRAEWQTNFKLKKDPRITRVGALLRMTSLDELPQLVNVLRGEMSLVGPRPLPVYHYEQLPVRVRSLRARVRPGVTGLWQVSGRSDAGTEGMARWDAYYVRNWSIWLDIVILVRTIRAVAGGHGAY